MIKSLSTESKKPFSRIRSYLRRGETQTASAKDAMAGLLGLIGFEVGGYAIFDLWDREIKGLLRGCEAIALQGTRLWVRVPSAVHRHELFYLKDKIIDRINQAMRRKVLTGVLFEFQEEAPFRDKRTIASEVRRVGSTHG